MRGASHQNYGLGELGAEHPGFGPGDTTGAGMSIEARRPW